MTKTPAFTPPTSNWQTPAVTWIEAIDRYLTFVQVPSWRVNAFKLDGSLSPEKAAALRPKMMRVLNSIACRNSVDVPSCEARIDDLKSLAQSLGKSVPKPERCSRALHWHFQRTFLLNGAGYTCQYCGRTAWEVFDEANGSEPRTLRFEIDHLVPKRKTEDSTVFDAKNLVLACRSCNTIKGEMDEKRFRVELQSLGRAVHRKYGSPG